MPVSNPMAITIFDTSQQKSQNAKEIYAFQLFNCAPEAGLEPATL